MENKTKTLKELYQKIGEWVKLYQANGGRKKLPKQQVAFFDEIKTILLPTVKKAITVQQTTLENTGGEIDDTTLENKKCKDAPEKCLVLFTRKIILIGMLLGKTLKVYIRY